jgi:hypothetical protein
VPLFWVCPQSFSESSDLPNSSRQSFLNIPSSATFYSAFAVELKCIIVCTLSTGVRIFQAVTYLSPMIVVGARGDP